MGFLWHQNIIICTTSKHIYGSKMGWVENTISHYKNNVYLHDSKALLYCQNIKILFQCDVSYRSIWLKTQCVNGIIHCSGLILFQLISCDHQNQYYHRNPCWIQWSSSWSHFSTSLPPTPLPSHISLNTYYFSPDVLHFRL